MNMQRKMAGKIGTLLIIPVLLVVPVSVLPCQEADIGQDTCCCCESSSQLSQPVDSKQHECPCQISEKEPAESSPAVITSNHERAPEPLWLASGNEEPRENCVAQLGGLHGNHFLLLSKDPPLYLLNSSFLI